MMPAYEAQRRPLAGLNLDEAGSMRDELAAALDQAGLSLA
jgi:hypothetical protein